MLTRNEIEGITSKGKKSRVRRKVLHYGIAAQTELFRFDFV